MKIRIIADDKIPFLKGAMEDVAEIQYLPGAATTAEDVRDAHAVITRTRTKCSAPLLDGSKVRFIATATIGFDHIDADYCAKHNIQWTSAPGCNSGSVMQYVTSTLLNLAQHHAISLKNSTLGVVGIGNVGSKVKRAAEALGMKVLCCDPPRQRTEGIRDFVALDRILAESDFITLHVPLNRGGEDRTLAMGDRDFFTAMKPGAFLINSSRGPVVKGDALKEALKSEKLKGAVLDVWEHEPDIDLELQELVDYGTPHIAGYSADGKANGTTMSVQAISRFFQLGINDWKVENVPIEDNPEILIPDELNDTQSRIAHAVNHCYDIAFDDRILRSSPETFEKQRGDYRIRREFFAFTVKGFREEEKEIFRGLGFQLGNA